MASLSYAYQSGGQMWVKAEAGTFAETAWTLSVAGLPAGATVNSVRLSFYLGYTYSTPSLTSVRVGDNVIWSKAQAEQGNYSAELTGRITGNGSYSLVFKNTARSSSRSYAVFSQIAVVINYTNPVSEFSLDQTSVDAGSAIKVNIARMDSGYTHRVNIALGTRKETISGVGTSLSYTIPLEWVDQLPSALSGTGTVTVETMNGATSMGSRSCNLTICVPESVAPSPGTLTVTAVNSYWGLYVQGYSQCRLEGSGYTPGLGASINSIYLSGNGDSVWADSMTSSLLRTAGDVSFTFTVRDSRGRAASTTAKINVTAYSPVAITGKVAYRCGTDGVEDRENGRCARLGVSYAMTSIGENAAEVQLWYRENGGSWTEITPWSDQSGAESVALNNVLALDKRYEIRFMVSDAITQAEQTAVIAPGTVFMVWNKKRRAFGFGEYPAGEKQFVIGGGWALVVNGKDVGQALDGLDPGGSGTTFAVDETLSLENGVLSVNRAEAVEKDNTLPITAAAVYTEVGNINALLATI